MIALQAIISANFYVIKQKIKNKSKIIWETGYFLLILVDQIRWFIKFNYIKNKISYYLYIMVLNVICRQQIVSISTLFVSKIYFNNMAETFVGLKESSLDSPTDKVISKVKELINSGILKPGDKLPAERKLALEFGFGRTQVREALHKLEFYGIIKTLPQSGSVVNGLDINTLDGLISDVLNLQNYDFFSLVETREVLEMNAIRLCAERWNEKDMKNLEKAHQNYVRFFDTPDRMSNDFAFHRAIAEASHNPVLKAMLMIVIPDILTIYQRDRICAPNTEVINEHEKMLTAIKNKNGEGAARLMSEHLKGVLDFARQKLEQENN